MAEQTVKCPRCGQMVGVPTSGEKVRCPGCGQKFRYETSQAPTSSPAPAPAPTPIAPEPPEEKPAEPPPEPPSAPPDDLPPPLPVARDVRCPDCGRTVQVPLTGEKVYCSCGRKFRVEEPTPPPERPVPEDLDAPLPVLPELLLGREARCPACGRTMQVSATAEKVRCPCGHKFWLDGSAGDSADRDAPTEAPLPVEMLGDEAPTPPPMPAQAAAPATKEVTCPDCGKAVQVPLSGEKVYCACGRKFRYEAPAAKPAERERPAEEPLAVEALGDEVPTPPPSAANQVKCPRCGGTVMVPTSGEKVRCPGCGQKFRFEAPAAPPSRPADAELPGIALPGAVLEAAAAAAPPTATPAAAEELRSLWQAIRQTVHRSYEGARATDEDRVSFRQQADRATVLASVFLGSPGPASSAGHVFATLVLPEMALDEILGLSLEDYRHLDETMDDVEHLLAARLPGAAPAPPAPVFPRPVAPAAAPAAAPAPRRRGLTTFEAAAAILSVAALAAAIIFFPEIKDLAARLQSRGDRKVTTALNGEPGVDTRIVPVPEPPKVATRVRPPRNKTGPTLKVTTTIPAVKIPDFQPPTPKPDTSIPVPPEKDKPEPPEPEPPLPKDKAEPPEPESPWAKLGPGAHRLFSGTDLKDWAQSGAWAVRGGEAHCRAAAGPVAAAVAGNPDWRDYVVQVRARIVRADRMTREGEYYLVILRYQDAQNFYCVRFPIEGIYEIGYYRNGAFHEVGRARHGLGSRFNQWHEVEIAIRGNQIAVVIDNIRTGAPPWSLRGLERGPLGVGVTGGEAAFEDVRVRVER
ncbi:MAG TPA: family 16 glycoside hydrolase [Planctomycetota bacterium]|nr:family 16 glycoside hydrolase [Planctomycetota bacterium]